MIGTLNRTTEGTWYVRYVAKSKDLPALDVVDVLMLHPSDENEKEYEYQLINASSYISHDVEFEIVESTDFVSYKQDEPPRMKTVHYAKLKG